MDGLLPAPSLPTGPSEVVLHYQPIAFRLSLNISAITALVGVCLLFLGRRFLKVAGTWPFSWLNADLGPENGFSAEWNPIFGPENALSVG